MGRPREPLDVAQCVGCSEDVAVYFESQRIGGDVFCKPCRRAHGRKPRGSKRGPQIMPTKPAPSCTCDVPRPDEVHGDMCITCFYAIPEERRYNADAGCSPATAKLFVQERVREGWTAPVEGGLSDGMSVRSFDPESLAQGLCVELEHTSCWWTALRITMDHLVEHPGYYPALEVMESELRAIRRRVLR